LLSLFKQSLFSLVQFVLFKELLGWFYLTWSGIGSNIEEVYVGEEVTFLHEFDGLRLSCDFLLKFEIIILLLEVSTTTSHILLVLVESVILGALAVLVNDLGFSFNDEVIPLLTFGFLLHLPNF
jgi:hypothetical protein